MLIASSSRQSMRSLTCGNGPWRSWGRRQWPQMTKTRGEKWEKYVGWSGKNVGFHSVLDLVFHCVEISYKYVQVKKPSHVVIHDVQVNSSKNLTQYENSWYIDWPVFSMHWKNHHQRKKREAEKFKTSIFRATLFFVAPFKKRNHGGVADP